jgi:hypothetical protein
MRRVVAVATVYVAAAILLTWPLATVLTTRLGALDGPGDPYLNLWTLGWGVRAWLDDPRGTLVGRAFEAPIFHPSGLTLTYSDHQLLQSLVVAPVYAATDNLALAYNLVLLGSLAGSGVAMHALAKAITGSTPAAFVAGLAWACWPYRTAHLLHLPLQALYFMPLALWALTRVAARRRWRDAAALGVCAALQAIASVYYGVMTAVALVVAAPALAWATGQWRALRYWMRVGVAGLVAGLLVLPVAVPYLRSQAAEGFGRNLHEAANHAAALQSYTQVPPDNAVYGRTGLLPPRPPAPGERDRRQVEHQMFPGVTIVLLALWGLWAGWRSDSRAIAGTSAALVVSGVWLSLGPEGPLGAYRYLATHVAGFDAIRAPARFAVVGMLGAVMLAAVGTTRLLAAVARRWPAAPGRGSAPSALAVAVMLGEYANAPLPLVEAPPTDTAVGRWLRDAPETGAVAYLPVSMDAANTRYMVEALQHGRPIVNGYSGQRPSSYTAIVESLATLPAAEGRGMLRELDVRFVVTPDRLDTGAAASTFVERAVLGGRAIYEVRWTPESEAALAEAPVALPPPPPGPVPFRAGEEATYEVRWIGDLAAGTIALKTAAPAPNDAEHAPLARWRFEASAATADWVSRFFEARDVFTTLATSDLMPLVHIRQMDEGARELTRAYVYDADRRQVRMGASPDEAAVSDALASPLFPAARDAVSALFYARTLPLAVGDDLTIPVNDAGRHLTARVRVEGVESVSTATGVAQALRLDVSLDRGLERRQGVSATLWMATDARRVPVRLDLSAGFGRVRVELVDYRP